MKNSLKTNYFELLKYPVFTMEHVNQYYDNIESARSAVKRLIKSGLASGYGRLLKQGKWTPIMQ